MKEKFKAAILRKLKTNLDLEYLEHTGLEPGQVKVRLITSSLCGAQINEIYGIKGDDKYLPHLMGHEGYGIVVESSENIRNLQVGNHVILHWRKGKGADVMGGKYLDISGNYVGSGPVTTFAEYTIVSENRVSKIEPNDSMKYIYPLVGCALSTSYGVVKYDCNPKPKSKVLLAGAGGLGLAIAFWLRILGEHEVVLFDKSKDKQALAMKFADNYISDISALNGSFDFCIDTTGNVECISTLFNLLGKNSKLLLVGQPKLNSTLKLYNPLKIFDGIKIQSSDGGNFNPDIDLNNILALLEENIDLANELITHKISLDDVNKGFNMMLSGDVGRVVIDFEI